EQAIQDSAHVLLVLSPGTINFPQVTEEVRYALKLQKSRTDGFKIIPLLLPGVGLGALHHWFGKEPIALQVQIGPGGLDEAMPALVTALREQLPTFPDSLDTRPLSPQAELLLELSDLSIFQEEGKRRAAATAVLTYRPPSGSTARVVVS